MSFKLISLLGVIFMEATKSKFLKVKCNDCQNEQIIFGSASTKSTAISVARRSPSPQAARQLSRHRSLKY